MLFDLGGVLLRLRPDDAVAAFARAGAPTFGVIWEHDTPQKSLLRLEVGAIDAATFRREVNAAMGTTLSADAFDVAFNAMLGPIAPAAFALLAALRKRYRVFLLSNNNVLHLAVIESVYPQLRGCFEAALFSQEIAAHKPAAEAFEKALVAIGAPADEILFIDDSQANIDAAAALGLQTHVLVRNADVTEALAHLL